MSGLRKLIAYIEHTSPLQKRVLMVVIDAVCLVLAVTLAASMTQVALNPAALLSAVIAGLTALFATKTYKTVVSHIGQKSYTRILLSASLTGFTLFMVSNHIAWATLTAFWSFLLTAGWRFLRTHIQTTNVDTGYKQKRIAIYGAGEAGLQAAASFQKSTAFSPVCFFDDNKNLHDRITMDLPIYDPKKLEDIITVQNIKEIVLAIPSANRTTRNQILKKLENINIPIRTLPGLNDIMSGKAQLADIQDIDPLDLLGRDPAAPDEKLLSKCIKEKVVLVTGAGGSIGSELCRQIITLAPKHLIILDSSEYALYAIDQELNDLCPSCPITPILGSVQNKQHIGTVIKKHKVKTIYHAAAYKHVPLVERNTIEAFRNNVIGTFNIAEAAAHNEVKHFVLISTDKAVRPTNVMGATKRLAEIIVNAFGAEKSIQTKFCFVRFGNVLDSSGSVIPLFRKQIDKGGPVTVTHPDMVRYFMSIPEAAQLVLQAGALAKGGDGFILDMGTPVKIVDMAQQMIKLRGLKPRINKEQGDIKITFSGLRSGEKLYEELFTDENLIRKTSHPQINCEIEHSNTPYRLADIQKLIEKLQTKAEKTLSKSLLEIANEQ